MDALYQELNKGTKAVATIYYAPGGDNEYSSINRIIYMINAAI